MNSARITIAKKIDVCQDRVLPKTYLISEMSNVIKAFDVVTVDGLAKPKKLGKIKDQFIQAGFSLYEILWENNAGFEGLNSDVINYRLVYTK